MTDPAQRAESAKTISHRRSSTFHRAAVQVCVHCFVFELLSVPKHTFFASYYILLHSHNIKRVVVYLMYSNSGSETWLEQIN